MYAAPPLLQTTGFARIPDAYRIRGRTNGWIDVKGVNALGFASNGTYFTDQGLTAARVNASL